MDKSTRRVMCAIALVACFALPATADSVTFTNLGPGGNWGLIGNDGFSILGVNSGFGYQSEADLFTAAIGGKLSQIDLGLFNLGGTNSAVISVYTDVSNTLGVLLFSGQVSNQGTAGQGTFATLATLSASSGVLVAGSSYFLLVEPGAADTSDGWALNSTGIRGTVLINTGSGFFNVYGPPTLGAFAVKVKPASTTPEPSTWLTFGTGLLGLLGAARRKRLLS